MLAMGRGAAPPPRPVCLGGSLFLNRLGRGRRFRWRFGRQRRHHPVDGRLGLVDALDGVELRLPAQKRLQELGAVGELGIELAAILLEGFDDVGDGGFGAALGHGQFPVELGCQHDSQCPVLGA